MIRDAYAMLCQEPWCMTPRDIGRLTDWQIEHLYARPAAERAEKFRKDAPGGGGVNSPAAPRNDIPHEPGSADHRAVIVSAMVNGPFKMTRESAEAAYERQLAEYRKGE